MRLVLLIQAKASLREKCLQSEKQLTYQIEASQHKTDIYIRRISQLENEATDAKTKIEEMMLEINERN
jgi:hypothetical protein